MSYIMFKIKVYLNRWLYAKMQSLEKVLDSWDFGSDEHWDRLEKEYECIRKQKES